MIEFGKALDENMALFDQADVDWNDAVMQVESALTQKIDKKALAKQTWEKLVQEHADGDKLIWPRKMPRYAVRSAPPLERR